MRRLVVLWKVVEGDEYAHGEADSERSDCELVERQCNGWGGDE